MSVHRPIRVRPFKNFRFHLVLAGLALSMSTAAASGPGTADPGFGESGLATTFVADQHELGGAEAVALQADGKIVVAGYGYPGDDNDSIDFMVVRYLRDGRRDPCFGEDGIVVADDPRAFSSESVTAVVIQEDGKILVAASTGTHRALLRLNPDGSIDPTFGENGFVRDNRLFTLFRTSQIAVAADGKILVLGEAEADQLALFRYNSDGSTDFTFDTDGMVVAPLAPSSRGDGIAIQDDGKIVVSGQSSDECAFLRFEADGALDTGFSGDGIHTISGGADVCIVWDVAVQDGGKIVFAGVLGSKLAVWRFDSDGTLDPTFDGDGIVTTTLAFSVWNRAVSVGVQTDGKVLVATGPDSSLVRYNADGTLDASFGSGGVAEYSGNPFDNATDVAIQPDGRIIVASELNVGDDRYFGVVRYLISDCGNTVTEDGEQCDDGNTVGFDGCGAGCSFEDHDCGAAPDNTCIDSEKSQFRLETRIDESRDKVSWNWSNGESFDQNALGTPSLDTTYSLCIYDTTSGTASLAGWLRVAAGEGWIEKEGRGWSLKDKRGCSDGVSKVKLKPGEAGNTKALLKAAGSSMRLPIPVDSQRFFNQDPDVVVQFRSSEGFCIAGAFDETTTDSNDGERFQGKK